MKNQKPDTNQNPESFTCIFSLFDGFVYRPESDDERKEYLESLREK